MILENFFLVCATNEEEKRREEGRILFVDFRGKKQKIVSFLRFACYTVLHTQAANSFSTHNSSQVDFSQFSILRRREGNNI